MHPFIETQKEWMKASVAPFRPGDTVRVNVRVKEGDKERVQAFEGVCIARLEVQKQTQRLVLVT